MSVTENVCKESIKVIEAKIKALEMKYEENKHTPLESELLTEIRFEKDNLNQIEKLLKIMETK